MPIPLRLEHVLSGTVALALLAGCSGPSFRGKLSLFAAVRRRAEHAGRPASFTAL
jgi:hypothetical protein